MDYFSLDSDLLSYEPGLFVDLPTPSQRLVEITDAAVDGAEVTSAAGGFSRLSPGHVAVLSVSESRKLSAAVAAVVDDHTLELQRVVVGLGGATDVRLVVHAFKPQRALAHARLLRAIGVDPDAPQPFPDAHWLISKGLMRRLESLGTLAAAYAGAVALVGDNQVVLDKAREYGRRFERELNSARILADTDGDGQPDAWLKPGVAQLTRS